MDNALNPRHGLVDIEKSINQILQALLFPFVAPMLDAAEPKILCGSGDWRHPDGMMTPDWNCIHPFDILRRFSARRLLLLHYYWAAPQIWQRPPDTQCSQSPTPLLQDWDQSSLNNSIEDIPPLYIPILRGILWSILEWIGNRWAP